MVRTFLLSKVSVPVSVKVPNPRPVSFVRAWRVGGGPINRVLDEPLVTVQGWGTSTVAASQLAEQCRDALLNEYTEMPLVRAVEVVSGPYLDPDPDSQTDRYTVTVRLRVRAQI